MKTVDLTQEQVDLASLLLLAQNEPILLLTAEGQEFLLSEADDFERGWMLFVRANPFNNF